MSQTFANGIITGVCAMMGLALLVPAAMLGYIFVSWGVRGVKVFVRETKKQYRERKRG